MKTVSKTQLAKALKDLTLLNAKAATCREIIMQYCTETYGVVPGDIDNDEYIDAVDNGCGTPSGMTLCEFEASMQRCLERFNR